MGGDRVDRVRGRGLGVRGLMGDCHSHLLRPGYWNLDIGIGSEIGGEEEGTGKEKRKKKEERERDAYDTRSLHMHILFPVPFFLYYRISPT